MKIALRNLKSDTPKAEKVITFKSTISDDIDDDMALIVKIMGKMYRRTRNFMKTHSAYFSTSDKRASKFERKKVPGLYDKKCYTCGGVGNISTVCRNNTTRPKAMKATTCSDSNTESDFDSSDDENSSSKRALMAISISQLECETTDQDSDDSDSECDSDDGDLKSAYNELYEEYKKATKKLESSRARVKDLNEKCQVLQGDKEKLQDEKEILSPELKRMEIFIGRTKESTSSSETLTLDHLLM